MRQPYRARSRRPGVVIVRVAYLRSEGSEEDIQSAMAALEEVGCDRVVVDSSTGSRPEARTALLTFLNRMKPGDDLVVTRLDQLATSMPRLVEFLAAMMDRGISVETIAGEIDTADPTVSQLIKSLWAFEQRAEWNESAEAFDWSRRQPRPAEPPPSPRNSRPSLAETGCELRPRSP